MVCGNAWKNVGWIITWMLTVEFLTISWKKNANSFHANKIIKHKTQKRFFIYILCRWIAFRSIFFVRNNALVVYEFIFILCSKAQYQYFQESYFSSAFNLSLVVSQMFTLSNCIFFTFIGHEDIYENATAIKHREEYKNVYSTF